MQVNLECSKTIEKIKLSAILDNRVLGLKAHEILKAMFGGTVSGGGNKQILWTNSEGVDFGIGVGKYPSCFIKSQYKGAGRTFPVNINEALKTGHSFMHLEIDGDNIKIQELSREVVLKDL